MSRVLYRRIPVSPQSQQQQRYYPFPAPVRGWISDENLSQAKPGGAKLLRNFAPTEKGIRARGGAFLKATIGAGTACQSMFVYRAGAVEKLFAANSTSVYEVTAPASPTVSPAAAFSGQTAGYYATAMMGTAGGNYLYIVNGVDKPRIYDGTTWTAVDAVSTPAITGVTTTTLSHVWKFANRLFFVQKNTMTAWYLPVDSIGGAVSAFTLRGIFTKGGSLLFGGIWSMDSGDGLDDKCVFISDQGEVAVYQGTDPSSAATWAKVGVYSIGIPLGINGWMKAGGDFLVATVEGLVPLSQAVAKDEEAISLASVTKNIAPDWTREALLRQTLPWEVAKIPNLDIAVVNVPIITSAQEAKCWVVNLKTGAWAEYTGWDTRCIVEFSGDGFFGTNTGLIYQMEAGGKDGSLTYTCQFVPNFDHLKAPGRQKTVHSARLAFITGTPLNPQVTCSVDYKINLPAVPASGPDYTEDVWDTGLWDTAIFDAGSATNVVRMWKSIGKTGFVHAPQLQLTMGITPRPNVELVSIELLYELGDIQVD